MPRPWGGMLTLPPAQTIWPRESAMKDTFRRIHRRLIPPANPHLGWMPYLYLVYLGFFFIKYFFVTPTPLELVAVFLTLGLFFYLYFTGYWRCGARQLVNVWGIAALGVVMAPINSGANVFFIYAGAFAPFVGSGRATLLQVTGLLVLVWLEAAWLQPTPYFWLPAAVFTPIVALANHHYVTMARKDSALRRSQAEVERMAQVAERERIARDLHDLLGHTLSVITLKSELAAKLVGRDRERAAAEIRDVERISREALAQVREAVTGYRRQGLQGEIDSASLALKSAGIAIEVTGHVPDVQTEVESVLAMVLREAVTNIIRHAGAQGCRIELSEDEERVRLEIADDGRGGEYEGGSGIAGMRERVAAIGGSLRIENDGGTRLRLSVPRRAGDEADGERRHSAA